MKLFTKMLCGFLTFALAFCLAGCEAKAEEENGPSNSAPEGQALDTSGMEEVFYREKLYSFESGCTVEALARSGDSLLVQGCRNDRPVLALAQYSVDESGKFRAEAFREIELDAPDSPAESRVKGLSRGEDGNFYLLTGEPPPRYYTKELEERENPDYQGRTAILCFSPEGELLGKREFAAWEREDVYGILAPGNGEIIIYGRNYISQFSWDEPSQVHFLEIDEGCVIMTGIVWREGVLFSIAGADHAYYMYSPSGPTIAPLTLYEESGPRISYADGNSVCQALDGELLLNEVSNFWSCGDDDKCYSLLRWNYSISPERFSYVCRVAEKTFVCSSGQEHVEVIGLRLEEKVQRSEVKTALVALNGAGAASALSERNLSSGPYTYVIIEYSLEDIPRLLTEIGLGEGPDLIIYDQGMSIDGNAFEDLYSFLDQDEELSRESFIPNYLQALSVDGGLYEIWPSVEINTLALRAAELEPGKSYGPADYQAIVEQSEKYSSLFDPAMTGENLMRWVSTLSLSAYIDKASASCSFDEPSFGALLAWCAGLETPAAAEGEPLLTLAPISNPLAVSAVGKRLGGDFDFVGFPLETGGGSFFACGLNGRMAIPKSSSNKAGAWDFIRSTLLTEAQLGLKFGLPVNQEAFQRKAEASLSEQDLELLTELVAETKYAENTADSALRDIIISSAQPYLQGEKSLEETQALIQSRASVYMSENYG